MLRLILLCILVTATKPYLTVPIKCEDLNIPRSSELCWMGVYLDRQLKIPSDAPPAAMPDMFEVQRRNSEISSALNSMYQYAPYSHRGAGKRNPEISNALLEYLNYSKYPK